MRITRFIIVCTILGTTPFAVAKEKPNVVMILADDVDTREPRRTKAFRITR